MPINDFQQQYNQGNEYFDSEDYANAAVCYSNALKHKPGDFNALHNLASSYMELENYEKAAQYFEKALAVDSKQFQPWFNMGYAYTEAGNYEKAEEAYKKALKLKPGSTNVLYDLGCLYLDMEEYAKGISILKEAVEQNSDDADVWAALGDAYSADQQEGKAISCYEMAASINPKQAHSLYNLGLLHFQAENAEQAAGYLEKYLKIKPKDPEALALMGDIMKKAGNVNRARVCFEKCLEINPDNFLALVSLAGDAYESGYYKKAAGLIAGAAKVEKPGLETLKIAADACIKSYNAGSAVEWLDAAAALANNPDDLKYLAKKYREADEKGSALKCLERAVKADPADFNARFLSGGAYLDLNALDEAVDAYKSAINLDPDNIDAWNALAQIHDRKGDHERSIGIYVEVNRRRPDLKSSWENLGRALIVNNQVDAAVSVLKRALDQDLANAEIYYILAVGYSRKRRKDRVMDYLKKAAEINPKISKRAKNDTEFKWIRDEGELLNL